MPLDVLPPLVDAELALRSGDLAAFCRASDRCVAADIPPGRLAELAIHARNGGLPEGGEYILRRFVESTSSVPEVIYYELAFQQRLKGNHREAAALLEKAQECPGVSRRSMIALAHMLYASDEHGRANAVLQSASMATEDERLEIQALIEFGTYLRRFPLMRSLDMSSRLRSGNAWLDHESYAARIMEALEQRKPFALIRLGDGEGACMTLGSDDEEAFASLYETNRQNRIEMWFGPGFPWKTNGFFSTCRDLIAAVNEADVVAIPADAWLRSSYRICSQRGIPSLVNILRALSDSSSTGISCPNLCTSAAAVELHLHGHIQRIIRAARDISVISCLPELSGALKSKFDLREVTLYQVPGEHGSRQALGPGVEFGSHFPDAFRKLMSELSTPHDGRVFLIAAGFLGKIYAATIKRHGGIAIDVGSLADRWMGRRTRPGDDPRLRLDVEASPAIPKSSRSTVGESIAEHPSERYLNGRFREIKGMSSRTAAIVSCGILRGQTEQGIRGSIAEIGVYEGRFFIALALCSRPTEKCVAVDTFEWPDPGVCDRFLANCKGAGVDTVKVIAERTPSGDLTPGSFRSLADGPVRFMHIDGAHGYDAVCHDLRLAKAALHRGGVLCLDDVLHPQFPELTVAVSDFLKSSRGFHLFAIVDRESFAASCKFLICRADFVASYKDLILTRFPNQVMRQRAMFFGEEVLIVPPFGPGS